LLLLYTIENNFSKFYPKIKKSKNLKVAREIQKPPKGKKIKGVLREFSKITGKIWIFRFLCFNE